MLKIAYGMLESKRKFKLLQKIIKKRKDNYLQEANLSHASTGAACQG